MPGGAAMSPKVGVAATSPKNNDTFGKDKTTPEL
jgi:hypothetical protein